MAKWIFRTGNSRRTATGDTWQDALRNAWKPTPPSKIGCLVSIRRVIRGGMLPAYGKTQFVDACTALSYCGWEPTVNSGNMWVAGKKLF